MNKVLFNIQPFTKAPNSSLLNEQLNDIGFGHSDFFYCDLTLANDLTAQQLLAQLLDAFIHYPSKTVGRLMRFRNVLVKPLGLRTAVLGCPVSSLLGQAKTGLFDNRFPVLMQQHTLNYSQVVLGADDKHLKFRSCAAVQKLASGQWQFSLGTRVHYNNWFGHIYMGLIDAVHRYYIAPTMLRSALVALINNHQTRAKI